MNGLALHKNRNSMISNHLLTFSHSLSHALLCPGINAQARKLQKTRSRVTSLFVDGSGEDVDGLGMWRSLSEMDLSAMEKEAGRAQQTPLREDPEAEADKEALRLGMEKEETESSDDNTTQYSIHPPFDFPYFLLLQGYSYRQVGQLSDAYQHCKGAVRLPVTSTTH